MGYRTILLLAGFSLFYWGNATALIPSRLLISLAKLSPLLLKLSVITRLGLERLTYSINPSKSEWSLNATTCSLWLICLQAERNSHPLTLIRDAFNPTIPREFMW
jgi:hypothetical protein